MTALEATALPAPEPSSRLISVPVEVTATAPSTSELSEAPAEAVNATALTPLPVL